MTNFELLSCLRSDCRFYITNTVRTAAYTLPAYDRKGNNLQADLNITTGNLSCSSCERKWKFIESYNGTHYEEIK